MKKSKKARNKQKLFEKNWLEKEERRKHRKKLRKNRLPGSYSYKQHINDDTSYNIVLDFLKLKDFCKEIRINYGEVNIIIPEVFSISRNPEVTIDVLKEIFYCGMNESIQKIFIDHTRCKELGIAASTVMDVILIEILKFRKSLKINLKLEGKLPENDGYVKDILKVSGILKHLGFKFNLKPEMKILPLISNKKSGFASTLIIDYFNKCLSTYNLSLSHEGLDRMSELVGEVTDNCEIHSGTLKRWYVLGHYYKHENKEFGECMLTIFDFGDTIYESLKRDDTAAYMVESLESITKRHIGFFKPKKWTEESLWTLYALQEGVSRKRDSKSSNRGSGTIRLLDSFQTIGKNPDDTPLMTITSGHIQILFDGKYFLKVVEMDTGNRQVIAFNNDNDLFQTPDENNVKILDNFFPGTIISMKFYIHKDFVLSGLEE